MVGTPTLMVAMKGSRAGYREQEAGRRERWRALRVAARMGRRRLRACSGYMDWRQKKCELKLLGEIRKAGWVEDLPLRIGAIVTVELACGSGRSESETRCWLEVCFAT